MAQVNRNVITQGLSGGLGDQIVFRVSKGGRTIVAMKPSYPANREFSPSQEEHREAFRRATAYAKAARNNPIYKAKAEGTVMSTYNAAVADWFSAPEVLEIDTSSWFGEAGQPILVKVQDDTHVSSVRVEIYSQSGSMLEQGVATQAEGLSWAYEPTTQVPAYSDARIVVTAKDLPGNSRELTWQNN